MTSDARHQRTNGSRGLRRAATCSISLSAVCMAALWSTAGAAEAMKASRLFELAKPATVMIEAHFGAQVTVPTPAITQAKLDAAFRRVSPRFPRGVVGQEPEAMRLLLLEVLANWPAYVMATDPVRTLEARIRSIGSGFVVTPDGYVVTNAHVVSVPEDELKRQFATMALRDLLAEDLKELVEVWGEEVGGQPPQDVVKTAQEAFAAFYQRHMSIGDVSRTVYTSMGVTVPGVAVTHKGLLSEVSMLGEPSPGKDVAILKAEGKNLPTLPVGDDTQLRTGDQIYVVGYPGAATFHPFVSEESRVEPTFTAGVISARKSMTRGWEVLQTDAAITHGNSGGPALDSSGKVIGIATFGSIEPGTGQAVAGMNFIVPISVVREFLNRHNVQPAESIVSRLYADALRQRDRQRYKKALKALQEINAIAPGHPYVQEQVSACQKAIAEGKDKTWQGVVLYAVLSGVAVLGFGGGVIALRRRGRRNASVDIRAA